MQGHEGFRGREITFTPDRLIADPVVFRGMSDTEVVGLFAGSSIFWIPISLFVMSFFNLTMFGIAVGFGLALLTLLVLSTQLVNIKRKLPDGLHVIWLKKQAQQRLKVVNFGYIDRSGVWDIRRTYPVKKANFVENEDVD